MLPIILIGWLAEKNLSGLAGRSSCISGRRPLPVATGETDSDVKDARDND